MAAEDGHCVVVIYGVYWAMVVSTEGRYWAMPGEDVYHTTTTVEDGYLATTRQVGH